MHRKGLFWAAIMLGTVLISGVSARDQARACNPQMSGHELFPGAVLLSASIIPGGLEVGSGGMEVDPTGCVYVAVTTEFGSLPTPNAIQPAPRNDPTEVHLTEIYLAKLSPGGNLVYGTYLGGAWNDRVEALAVDATGAVVLTGYTDSADFPIEGSSYGYPGHFALKVAPEGNRLLYSVPALAASDVKIDPEGRAWLVSGGGSGRLSRLSVDGELEWSKSLASQHSEESVTLALAEDGTVFLAGSTQTPDLPVVGGWQDRLAGGWDGYVARLSAAGELLWSSYLGGRDDDLITDVALDAAGRSIITGTTRSSDFPTRRALQRRRAGHSDGFVTRFSADGMSLDFSTFLGASRPIPSRYARRPLTAGNGVAVAGDGTIWVAGQTNTKNFPLERPAQRRSGQNGAASFVSALSPDGQILRFSSLLGGGTGFPNVPADTTIDELSVSPNGSVYLLGKTVANDFPVFRPLDPQAPVYPHDNSYLAALTTDPIDFGGRLRLSHRKIDFGTIQIGKTVRRNLHLSNPDNTPLRIAFSGAAAAAIVGSKETVIAPGQRQTVAIEVGPFQAGGRFRTSVALVTSDPRHAIEYVDLVGKVVRRR